MNQYKIAKDRDNEIYNIVEIEHESVIYKNKNYDKAKVIYELLKKGSGFAGWTPTFFTVRRK